MTPKEKSARYPILFRPRRPLQEALKRFNGEIDQIPPAYSAIKINGQRAYKLAREGKEVKIESRKVTINRLEMTDYTYPEVQFIADVTSGTYIRTLVEDIGQTLGTGAYTSVLRRRKIDGYDVTEAICPKEASSTTFTASAS